MRELLEIQRHTSPVEPTVDAHTGRKGAATREPDYRLKLIFVWLLILPFLAVLYSIFRQAEPLSLQLLPEVPRPNEPTVLTAKMSNDNAHSNQVVYTVHVDGKLLAEGTSQVAANTEVLFQYFRGPTVDVGERVNFAVDTHTEGDSLQRVASSPAYAPQIWSSFVSFATFSTSVMSSLVTAVYYQGAFGTTHAPNSGWSSWAPLSCSWDSWSCSVRGAWKALSPSGNGGLRRREDWLVCTAAIPRSWSSC